MFMRPEIVEGIWYNLDTNNGRQSIPVELVRPPEGLKVGDVLTPEDPGFAPLVTALSDYLMTWDPDGVREIALVEGAGARLSASGYMDCTEWTVYPTLAEAEEGLKEMYEMEKCPECGEWWEWQHGDGTEGETCPACLPQTEDPAATTAGPEPTEGE